MKKVVLLSLFLMIGLVASQSLPFIMGDDYTSLKSLVTTPLLYICLSFIMINVGREFEINKRHWKVYTLDYFVAMASADLPWILISLYYIFVLLPPEMWGMGDVWKENLLVARFASPTSAGILFTMLATLRLTKSWVYRKIQNLAIFDDLDTILLMIPLQIMMTGLKWQMGAMVVILFLLLRFGWQKLDTYDLPQGWRAIILYSIGVFAATHSLALITEHIFGAGNAIEIEVLLPAFILGVVIKHKHTSSYTEQKVASAVSVIFMLLVGMSIPLVLGGDFTPRADVMISQVPMMGWGEIALHVLAVSILSNLGKMVPLLFYRTKSFSERLALSIGMFTRGEVGAGVIFIAISYHLDSNALIISALTLVLNLVLTGVFVAMVGKLVRKTYNPLPVIYKG